MTESYCNYCNRFQEMAVVKTGAAFQRLNGQVISCDALRCGVCGTLKLNLAPNPFLKPGNPDYDAEIKECKDELGEHFYIEGVNYG